MLQNSIWLSEQKQVKEKGFFRWADIIVIDLVDLLNDKNFGGNFVKVNKYK